MLEDERSNKKTHGRGWVKAQDARGTKLGQAIHTVDRPLDPRLPVWSFIVFLLPEITMSDSENLGVIVQGNRSWAQPRSVRNLDRVAIQ